MEQEVFRTDGLCAQLYRCNTAIVGSGAAGYNAADCLWRAGQHDILLLTENRLCGTSRNTGSDKQTYYKLTLSGGDGDSVREMAQTLFDGQCVDGDTALCEAALSAPCFLRLAELGVEFPRSRYGEYVGYKTDHDPRRRATSAGPYTSKRMTQMLEAAVCAEGVPMLDGMQVIRILTDGERVLGLLCLNRAARSEQTRYALIHCRNVIWATGGPAGIYADSVYPAGHHGSTGIALEAGAIGQNLTEWQYGLASLHPRWNVSGTYMQVLPRMISTTPDQTDEREFLMDFFKTPAEMLSKLFLKGYQWPFDVKKIEGGSSIIDVLVYLERCKGRRVWLDFRRNLCGDEIDFSQLDVEAQEYLTRAGACFGTPIERLRHMNAPAVEFYREHGVDLETQPLEIALCAQHNNGGLAVDCWWQTNIKGLFAAGEAAGTHGVCRPGGTALNAGQVGSRRAAEYISRRCTGALPEGFDAAARDALTWANDFSTQILRGESNFKAIKAAAQLRMSRCGGAIRNSAEIALCLKEAGEELRTLDNNLRIASPDELPAAYGLRDLLLAQQAYLSAMADYAAQYGKSRGSALYTDPQGRKPYAQLPDAFTFALDDGSRRGLVQQIQKDGDGWHCTWRTVRPIPQTDDFFENVWRSYRETGNVD